MRTSTPTRNWLLLAAIAALAAVALAHVDPKAWAGTAYSQYPSDQVYTSSVYTCGSASSVAVAAATEAREVTLLVPTAAAAGIRIAFDATDASASTALIEPGQAFTLSGRQAVNCARAAGVDVAISLIVGVAGRHNP